MSTEKTPYATRRIPESWVGYTDTIRTWADNKACTNYGTVYKTCPDEQGEYQRVLVVPIKDDDPVPNEEYCLHSEAGGHNKTVIVDGIPFTDSYGRDVVTVWHQDYPMNVRTDFLLPTTITIDGRTYVQSEVKAALSKLTPVDKGPPKKAKGAKKKPPINVRKLTPILIGCPYCAAKKGALCKSSGNHTLYDYFHADRWAQLRSLTPRQRSKQ